MSIAAGVDAHPLADHHRRVAASSLILLAVLELDPLLLLFKLACP
jgi:hypothetical protein